MTLEEQISVELEQAEISILNKYRYIIKSEGYDIEKCNKEGVHTKLYTEIKEAVTKSLRWKIKDVFIYSRNGVSQKLIIVDISLFNNTPKGYFVTYHCKKHEERNDKYVGLINFESLEDFQVPNTDTIVTFEKIAPSCLVSKM